MPLEPRPETEAYRLCQPMHVLSFGEGRWSRSLFLPSPLWDGLSVVLVVKPFECVTEGSKFLWLWKYFAPSRPRRRQWFERRFDRDPFDENSRSDKRRFLVSRCQGFISYTRFHSQSDLNDSPRRKTICWDDVMLGIWSWDWLLA
jgi:hypothetical protein